MSDDKGMLDQLRTQWVDSSTPPKPLLLQQPQNTWAEFSAAMIGNTEPTPESVQQPQIDYEAHRNRYLLGAGIRLNHVGFSRLNNAHNPRNVHPEAYGVFEGKSGQNIPLTMRDVDSLDFFIFAPVNLLGADAQYIDALKNDLEIVRDQMDAGLETMRDLGYVQENAPKY